MRTPSGDGCGDLVLRITHLLPRDLRRSAAVQIRSDLASAHATDDVERAKPVLRAMVKLEYRDHNQDVKHEARLAAFRAEAFPPGLGYENPNTDDAFLAKPFKRVKEMSPEERRRALEAKDECSVCKQKHFGPTGPARTLDNGKVLGCFGDKAVPFPPELKERMSEARYKYIMSIRQGAMPRKAAKAALAQEGEDDGCLDCLEDYANAAIEDHAHAAECRDDWTSNRGGVSRMTEKGGKPIRRKEKNHLDQFGNLLRMDF